MIITPKRKLWVPPSAISRRHPRRSSPERRLAHPEWNVRYDPSLGGGGGGGASSGFTPNTNWTMTGQPFADGNIVTLTYTPGGLSIPTDPRPEYWAPLEANLTKDATYSRSTSPALALTTNASFQSTIKPTNSAGALDQLFLRANGTQPGSGGPIDAGQNFFTDSITQSISGNAYVNYKRYRGYDSENVNGSGRGLNSKNFRLYDTFPGSHTNCYIADGFIYACNQEGTAISVNTLKGVSGNYFPWIHQVSTWATEEIIFKESSTNTIDGFLDYARNGSWAFGASTRQWNTRPTDADYAKTVMFLSQYSFTGDTADPYVPPDSSHEYINHLYVNNNSRFRIIISDEATYRTTGAGATDPGVTREIQLPTQNSGSSFGASFFVRQGAFASLSGKRVYLIDGNEVDYYVGVGI